MNTRFNNGTYYRYAIVSYDKAGNASRGMPVVVRPSALLRSPAAGRVVHTGPAPRLGKSCEGELLQRPALLQGTKKSLSAVAERRQSSV